MLKSKGVSHIFCATSEEEKFKIIDSIKDTDIQLWYSGVEGDYLCNEEVFTFSASLVKQLLPAFFYFSSRGYFRSIVITSSLTSYDLSVIKTVKLISESMSISYRGNITLDFNDENYIDDFLRFLDDNYRSVFLIITIKPNEISKFYRIFEVVKPENFDNYVFTFLYADTIYEIPKDLYINNFYYLSQYCYDENNELSSEFLSLSLINENPYDGTNQLFEYSYSSIITSRKIFSMLNSSNVDEIRSISHNFTIPTPHGNSKITNDNHMTFPYYLLHYNPDERKYEKTYSLFNSNKTVEYNTLQTSCGNNNYIINIGLVTCQDDVKKLPEIDLYQITSLITSYATEGTEYLETSFYIVAIPLCDFNDATELYTYIIDKNISFVFGYEWYL